MFDVNVFGIMGKALARFQYFYKADLADTIFRCDYFEFDLTVCHHVVGDTFYAVKLHHVIPAITCGRF